MSDHIERAAPVQEQFPTNISVRIHSVHTSGPLLANASIDLNGCFAVRGVKVVQGEHGPFVSMPSYKAGGEYKDVCFPVTKEFREQLHTAVMGTYQQELAQLTQRGQAATDHGSQEAQEPPFPQQTM